MDYKFDLDTTIARIKDNEGFRTKVYKDTLGNETIGYGFTIRDLRLSEPVSAIILQIIVGYLSLRIYDTFPWFRDMPAPVKSVIIEMCYQMGMKNFMMFKKTIRYLKGHKFFLAAQEMLDSHWARFQSPERAKRLSDIVAGCENG